MKLVLGLYSVAIMLCQNYSIAATIAYCVPPLAIAFNSPLAAMALTTKWSGYANHHKGVRVSDKKEWKLYSVAIMLCQNYSIAATIAYCVPPLAIIGALVARFRSLLPLLRL
jgi:hypothetical protein